VERAGVGIEHHRQEVAIALPHGQFVQALAFDPLKRTFRVALEWRAGEGGHHEHEPQPATAYQLTTTFCHLAGSYRIRLAQKNCEEFLEACQTTADHLLIRLPHIYFRCADRPDHYLRFAWFGYAALLIGET